MEDFEDDEVNLEENVNEAEGGPSDKQTPAIQVTQLSTRPAKLSQTEETLDYDYSLADELFALLDGQGEIQPITCGYFNKIVVSLLGKARRKMLHYLLLHRRGDVYMKLMQLLEHHSLSTLLIELLYLKVQPAAPASAARDRFSSDFDKDEGENGQEGEEEKKEADPTEGMRELE